MAGAPLSARGAWRGDRRPQSPQLHAGRLQVERRADDDLVALGLHLRDLARADHGATRPAPALPRIRPLGLDRVDLAVGPGAESLDHVAVPVEPAPEYVHQEGVRVAM